MSDRREGLFIGAAMLGLVAFPLLGLFAWMSVKLGEDFFIPTLVVGSVASVLILRGPLGRALARRLEGGAVEVSPEQQVEIDDLRGRVLELEERLDFAERMLARPPDVERIERT